MRSIFLHIILFTCIISSSQSQSNKWTGSIRGTTVDAQTKDLLPGVLIYLHKVNNFRTSNTNLNIQSDEHPSDSTYTNTHGEFYFTRVQYGRYLLSTKYIGYRRTYYFIQYLQEIEIQATIYINSYDNSIDGCSDY